MDEIKGGKGKNRKHAGRKKILKEKGGKVKEISEMRKKQKKKAKYRCHQ